VPSWPVSLYWAGYWIGNATEHILFGGAKAGRKSFPGASLMFGDALIYPKTHCFIARREFTAASRSLVIDELFRAACDNFPHTVLALLPAVNHDAVLQATMPAMAS